MKNSLLDILGWYDAADKRVIASSKQGSDSFTWRQLRTLASSVGRYLDECPDTPVVLYEPFAGYFLAALIPALLRGRDVYLPGHANWSPGDSSVDPAYWPDELRDAVYLGSGRSELFREIGCFTGGNHQQYDPESGMDDGRIIFLTSGSTGEPKQIIKKCRQVSNEVAVLAGLWGDSCRDRHCGTTVSHQHLYGFLYYLGMALAGGAVLESQKIEYPESLKALPSGPNILISSPAFLSRLSVDDGTDTVGTVFSSGGPLPETAASNAEKIFGSPVIEVFGSTETGGIAYRRLAESRSWTPFSGIELSADRDGRLIVVSDYLEDRTPYLSQDMVEFQPSGSFVLTGRADSIVKIEEKRVSLGEMSERLERLDWIEKAVLLPIGDQRRGLGAVVVPDEARMDRILRTGRRQSVDELKVYLREFYTPILIPRKWRFLKNIATNDMGKTSRKILDTLFTRVSVDFSCEIVQLDGESLECVVSFPDNHRFFDGHFPGDPILPGVAQIHSVLRLAERYLGFYPGTPTVPRVKFSRLIRPNERMLMRAVSGKDRRSLSFSISALEDGSSACKGSLRSSEGESS